ncbi:hypothetical protein S245_068218, partial [Arachis hypogaea]
TNSIANYSCYCKFHEDMVDILHVSLFNPKWSFGCSFLVCLHSSCSNPLFDFAKVLEGQVTF